MAWIYGADNFMEDLKYMLGFCPFPRMFWYWAWKLISPSIVLCILVMTAREYSGNKYADYSYPAWANAFGWLISFSSILLIPAVALIKIYREDGTLKQVRYLTVIVREGTLLCLHFSQMALSP